VTHASSCFTPFQGTQLRPQHLQHPISCHVSPFSHLRNAPLITDRARATAAHFNIFRPASYSGGSRRCAAGYSPCTWSACFRALNTPACIQLLANRNTRLRDACYVPRFEDNDAYGEMPSELPLPRQPWRRVTPTQTTSLALLSRYLTHTLFDLLPSNTRDARLEAAPLSKSVNHSVEPK
jgi:hypothetical protein